MQHPPPEFPAGDLTSFRFFEFSRVCFLQEQLLCLPLYVHQPFPELVKEFLRVGQCVEQEQIFPGNRLHIAFSFLHSHKILG